MVEIKQILALSKLLEFASNLKHGLKNENISFDDEVGKIAFDINNRLKKTKGLDIFSKSIIINQVLEYEHLISNSISNYTNRQIVKRDISDEVEMLLKTKLLPNEYLRKFKILCSMSIDSCIEKIPELSKETLLSICENPEYLSELEGEELNEHYFISSRIELNTKKYVIVLALRNETRKKNELTINCFLIFLQDEYLKYINNPTQLFLKGLDKYGIDMKIGAEISRYYYHAIVPTNSSIQGINFLNLQNIGPYDDFTVGMSMKNTGFAIELSNVYAINTSKFNSDMEKYFAQQ
jgi:hypothetical protein